MNRLKKGDIHIYTGNGKGKTTAALGLALRAAGSGLKTFVAMFSAEYDMVILDEVCVAIHYYQKNALARKGIDS